MQTNDFEKRIQGQLDQFKIAPGDAVWDRVAVRIKKERKRRRFLVWFFTGMFLLAGGAGAWFFYNQAADDGRSTAHAITNMQPATPPVPDTQNNIGVAKDQEKTTMANSIDQTHSQTRLVPNPTTKTNHSANKQKGVLLSVLSKAGRQHKEDSTAIYNQAVESYMVKKAKSKNINPVITGAATKQSFLSIMPGGDLKLPVEELDRSTFLYGVPVKNPGMTGQAFALTTLNVIPITSVEPLHKVDVPDSSMPDNSLAKKTTIKIPAKHPWKWGIAIYTGVSDNVNGLDIATGAKALDMFASPGLGNATPVQPAVQKFIYYSGFSSGIGINMQKTVAKKWGVVFGLDYRYYSIKTLAGRELNLPGRFSDFSLNSTRLVSSYYQAGSSTTVTNSYHSIALPIHLSYDINIRRVRPVQLVAGLSPGYLVSTNALYYNRTTGNFYRESEQIKKFQWMIDGAVSYPFFSLKKFTISLGPVFQYGLSNLTRSAANTDEHIFFIGLKTKLLLHK